MASEKDILNAAFKMSFSDAISINEDGRIYTSEYLREYSSVLGTRVGILHLTKFDVEGVHLASFFDEVHLTLRLQ